MALRLEPGKKILDEEQKQHGLTPSLAFVYDYHAFLSAFINESPNPIEADAKDFEKRLKVLEGSDKKSPFHLYSQAEALIHKAALRFKFNDFVKGAGNVRSAYLLLKKNIKLYPNFKPHYKSMGMLEVLIGTVPPRFQWITSMLGMQGNMEAGMAKIHDFMYLATPDPEIAMLKQEAIFLYGFLQVQIVQDKEEAWKVVEGATKNYRQNLLHCFVRAAVGMQCKKTEEVIRTLEARPKGKAYARFYQLEYMLGTAKLFQLSPDADIHFKIFVTFTKGENHIKMAYMKLAWSKLIQGDKKMFDVYTDLAIQKGESNFEEDKVAEQLANEGVPDVSILKGRLLFDGGYYDKAIAALNSISVSSLSKRKEQVELTYRRGRVYDEMGKDTEALKAYAQTMESGKNETWYFAANSALKSAQIYEEQKKYALAKKYFEMAMEFPNDEYEDSIKMEAKSGLNRIKTK